MLRDVIRARMLEAMKAGEPLVKNVLKVALGEIQATAVREGRELTDEESQQIVRKLVKSNEESRAATTDAARRDVLARENETLATLLPATLDEDATADALAPVVEQVRAAGSDGQATGVAMKHLRSVGAAVDGRTVAAAVRRLRSS